MAEELSEDKGGRIDIGYAKGLIIIDIKSNDGKRGIVTSIDSEEDALEIIRTLSECTTLAFRKMN